MAVLHAGASTPDALGFFDTVWSLMLDGDPRVRHLGGHLDADAVIARRAAVVTRSVWNLQRTFSLSGLRTGMETDRRHGGHLEDSREVVSPGALRSCPLLPSAVPYARVGAVAGPMIVTDGEHVFLGGPDGTELDSTIWETTDPALVARAERTFLTCWESARPVSEVDTRPLLPPRLLEVALLLVDGATDREIADALGVGTRTASTEVRRVIDWTGATNRGRAIAVICGADA